MSSMIQSGRFASPLPVVTLNPSDKHGEITLSAGDLVATKIATDALRSARATRGIVHTDNGYFEVFLAGSALSPFQLHGVSTSSLSLASFCGSDTNSWGYYQDTGEKFTNNAGAAYGASYTIGDIVGVAFKNGKLWFAKNNTWQGGGDPAAGTGEAFSGITGTIYPTISLYRGIDIPTRHIVGVRFNTANFTYSPPSGFGPWGS